MRFDWRRWSKVGFAITMAVGALIVVAAYCGCTFGLHTHDRATVVTVALTYDLVLLAVVAAAFAFVAYLAASGRPDLDIEFRFPENEVNEPVLQLENVNQETKWANIRSDPQSVVTVVIRNLSTYSAKNPTVVIKCVNFTLPSASQGWTRNDSGQAGEGSEVQWDGGADYLIHGSLTRTLPKLGFQNARVPLAEDHRLEVTLVADGVLPKSVTIPVRFLDSNEYADYYAERSQAQEELVDEPRWQ